MNRKYEWSALILRVVLGVSFFVHGLAKFQGGLGNIAGWFDSIGLPGFLAYGVAFLEAAGGIALVIGLGTKVLSALFALLMIGAMVKVKLAAGFLGDGQSAGYELDLAFLAMAVSLVLTGSKLYSVDSLLFGRSGSN
ncbi:DoxX family protein [Pseudobacillus badius]|uniref:DoxX family protein n=1 Tax=Bacillus badius TaxID=1455 RepID=UPI0007B0998F|nr:DoxX family protein [Bacillus badius]KZN99744.1 oxidoreductase [Bacillus badius]MED0666530.1 DoxX family protein [Bacillus badius]OCS85848.1 oxidoreductase [Bacillus badius]OVE51794.1 oxidoreductase [Bacillus badius]TDW03219.1 putative membrane protein YphA (DoxX/SURF4 family) [Bacillus badius]